MPFGTNRTGRWRVFYKPGYPDRAAGCRLPSIVTAAVASSIWRRSSSARWISTEAGWGRHDDFVPGVKERLARPVFAGERSTDFGCIEKCMSISIIRCISLTVSLICVAGPSLALVPMSAGPGLTLPDRFFPADVFALFSPDGRFNGFEWRAFMSGHVSLTGLYFKGDMVREQI